MSSERFWSLARYATLALPVSVVAISVLRVGAAPSQNRRMVPIASAKAKTSAPKIAARTGQQIYKQMCASCHGANGQGGKAYKKPLEGDKSVGQLAKFIRLEMPPGAPQKLPISDAQKVAAYIHQSFYSPLARARNKPARVELSRLTVRQYRNAVTDLVASFRWAENPSTQQGLKARYFKRQPWSDTVLERVDPQIKFDFGTGAPHEKQDEPYQFSMFWEGSVLAPETGEYEFVIRTDQGASLWINDPQKPLVDGHVKSGNSNEYSGTIFLLGGRRYPLKLEFSKGVHGVNDLKKLKEKPVQSAFLSLEWKIPHRATLPIEARYLSPQKLAPVFVTKAPFPPDDRSIGYERGTSVSREWADAATEAALETTSYVMENLAEISGVKDDDKERHQKLRDFCRKWTERAFRRPLSESENQLYVHRHFENSNSETAVKRALLLSLTSPRFLYREVSTRNAGATPVAAPSLDSYDVASRLSFALWDSLPDNELLRAAGAGELSTRDGVWKQAERMANDPRAWAKMREFLLQWLKVDHNPELAKNPKRFPKFNEHIAADLRTSLELSLESIAWNDKSDFRELMLSDKVFLNGRLAEIYGVNLPADAPFQPVALDGGGRSGVLTHPYLLSVFGYLDTSSPIHRGVLISRNVLGRQLRQPPAAFTPLDANLHPRLTTRQRVALQTKPPACSSCHSLINPLGFSLENYDAIGRARKEENGSPIDASGIYASPSGREVKFSGARDLAKFLAESDEVHASFTQRLFQYVVKQPVRAYGPQTQAKLQQSFKDSSFNMRRQMTESAVLAAMYDGAISAKPAGAQPARVATSKGNSS